jgi:hypothetical protein
MSDGRKVLLVLLVGAVLLAMVGIAETQKAGPTPPPNDKSGVLAAGETAAKQLLVLMDTDKSGKVSKQEWMSFMEAEFDRLDKNKDGELDVKELEQSQFRPAPFTAVGK